MRVKETTKPQVSKIDVGLYILCILWIPGLPSSAPNKASIHPLRASDVPVPSGVWESQRVCLCKALTCSACEDDTMRVSRNSLLTRIRKTWPRSSWLVGQLDSRGGTTKGDNMSRLHFLSLLPRVFSCTIKTSPQIVHKLINSSDWPVAAAPRATE